MHVRMVALVSVEMIWKKSKQFVAGTCLHAYPPHADPKLLLPHWTDFAS